MKTLLAKLYRDENGFVISAELILVATIAVLSMVVGLSTVSHAIGNELEDMAKSFSAMNGDDGYGNDGYNTSSNDDDIVAN